MSILTTFFNLIKPAKTDGVKVSDFNDNMDVIDAEMHRPPLTVNEQSPDANRNIKINVVPLADNLTTDKAQLNTGDYIIRTSGGEASIADGNAWLNDIRGNMVKTGYVPEVLQMTVNAAERGSGVEPITATIDRNTFVTEVTSSGTVALTYTSSWSADPATYGITVSGTPISGDEIVVVYVKENRGTIVTAYPTAFVSTGWNLYNHAAGYARVFNYSDEYGFGISGTYTSLKFAETLTGEQVTINPEDGYFTLPEGATDGYLFVTGGNATDTAIWMTWSDWTEQPNNGTFRPYSATTIDLTGVMVSFPAGLCRVGNVFDEINLNTQQAISRIIQMEYTEENLASVILSGVAYDTDTDYIYAERETPIVTSITVSNQYTVSDHGLEMFNGTAVPLTASSLYGQDLKGKLIRDVLTISQQTLTEAQKTQVRNNIDVPAKPDVVMVTPQTLTDAQKAQARSNINASAKTADVSNSFVILSDYGSISQKSVYYTPGKITVAFVLTLSESLTAGVSYNIAKLAQLPLIYMPIQRSQIAGANMHAYNMMIDGNLNFWLTPVGNVQSGMAFWLNYIYTCAE